MWCSDSARIWTSYRGILCLPYKLLLYIHVHFLFRCDNLLVQCTVMDYLKPQETVFLFKSSFLLLYWKGNNCCSTIQTSRYIFKVLDGVHKYSFCVVCKQGTWFSPATIHAIKIQVFWDVTLCRGVNCYRRFEAVCGLPLCVHAVQ
jgi:hypothetical protein